MRFIVLYFSVHGRCSGARGTRGLFGMVIFITRNVFFSDILLYINNCIGAFLTNTIHNKGVEVAEGVYGVGLWGQWHPPPPPPPLPIR